VSRSTRWAASLAVAVDVVWWLSLAVAGLAGALLIVVAAHVVRGGALKLDVYFQLPSSAYHISSDQLAGSAGHFAVTDGQLAFARPKLAFVLVSAVVLALTAGWWLFVLHQLRRLLAELRDGETFARQNAVRLRRIGIAVVGFEIARALVIWSGGLYLEHALVARGLAIRAHFGLDLPMILLGIVLLALAAAFAVGSELAEDQALTV
jgi:Protein of unknown function (DUF2975)